MGYVYMNMSEINIKLVLYGAYANSVIMILHIVI